MGLIFPANQPYSANHVVKLFYEALGVLRGKLAQFCINAACRVFHTQDQPFSVRFKGFCVYSGFFSVKFVLTVFVRYIGGTRPSVRSCGGALLAISVMAGNYASV